MPDLRVASRISIGGSGYVFSGIGSGNIWVEEDYGEGALNLVREIILKSLLGTAPGQLEVTVFDYSLRGVASPFSVLQGLGLFNTLITEREIADYLEFLKVHIQGVNNVIQGRAKNLVKFRESLGQTVESYKLVVISADLFLMEDKLKENLSILLSSGPAAGVTFLIVSAADEELRFLRDKCQYVSSGSISSALDINRLLASCDNLVQQTLDTSIDPIGFEEVQPLDSMWMGNSTDGITFSLGKYGAEITEITLGNNREQRHNALITGAVGQGKSNVISVMIHSLCQRYSPAELELYLLDFKEGVTLQAYSDRGQEEWLVHAKALGLESDVAFGIAVLEHLFGVYEERMDLFKSHGVQGIKDYRELTGAVLPRILLVIDEFQMMLEERENEKRAAGLLSKSARLFRAAGIHIVLASQTIANGLELSKDSDLFAQTPIRIALKNSIRESEATLGMGNIAASDVRIGQAIVNLDYGLIASNRKVAVAYADPELLGAIRRKWWLALRGKTRPPYVFDGHESVYLRSFVRDLLERRQTRQSGSEALLGKTISVDGHPLFAKLSREFGRNVALIGSGARGSIKRASDDSVESNIAIGIMQSAALSIALQNTLGNAQFILCDYTVDDGDISPNMKRFVALVQRLGFLAELLTRKEFEARLGEVAQSLLSRTASDDDLFILGFALDRMGNAPFGFQEICRNGSAAGVHLIGWWQKMDRFEDQIGFGNSSYFDVKVMLRVDARDVQRSLGIYGDWKNENNRAFVSDVVYLEQPERIIPVLPMTVEDVRSIESAIM